MAGLFYAAAGVEHIRATHRSRNETLAMASDLGIAVVLLAYAGIALL